MEKSRSIRVFLLSILTLFSTGFGSSVEFKHFLQKHGNAKNFNRLGAAIGSIYPLYNAKIMWDEEHSIATITDTSVRGHVHPRYMKRFVKGITTGMSIVPSLTYLLCSDTKWIHICQAIASFIYQFPAGKHSVVPHLLHTASATLMLGSSRLEKMIQDWSREEKTQRETAKE